MGWSIQPEILVLQFLLLLHFSDGLTNPKDVAAINSLYAAFGTPKLPGWVLTGGDPCAEAWQGVQCDTTNIISIILVGANLGGGLGNNLGSFTSIETILCLSQFLSPVI
uniref:Receptor protein serine/threonine kinase n=1 Tax=Opuntia streptacantha TaxID=393608 RepID=A0A7C8ZNL7_OPUST